MNLPESVIKQINMEYARRFTALLACECCGIKSDNLEEVKEFVKQKLELANKQVHAILGDPAVLSHPNFTCIEKIWLDCVLDEVIKFRYAHLIK